MNTLYNSGKLLTDAELNSKFHLIPKKDLDNFAPVDFEEEYIGDPGKITKIRLQICFIHHAKQFFLFLNSSKYGISF